MAIWKEAGFFMICCYAALQVISPSLGEASAIEGAARSTFFRRVQFPLLMPTTLFVLINAFRMIDHILVMTRGGPDNATTLPLFYIHQVGFGFWDATYAAALTCWRSSPSSSMASGHAFMPDGSLYRAGGASTGLLCAPDEVSWRRIEAILAA